MEKAAKFECHSYRTYNQAYFEQIIITKHIEGRTAKNFRDRFINSNEELFIVLKMYAEKDYLDYFVNAHVDEMNHHQLTDLFLTSLHHDSFRIALHVYLRYLS